MNKIRFLGLLGALILCVLLVSIFSRGKAGVKSEEEAVRIALAELKGKAEVPNGTIPKVSMEGNNYIVTFPANHPLEVRGGDFHARIWIDKKTGEVVKREVGV